jgi:phosphate transport system permease protein
MRSPDAVAYFKLHAEHLEGSLGRLFRKIHYEGYRESSYSWQSAAATDDFEAKFSLWPLIWGTLKATLYAMLFAAPLGIFAAVYSSEILDRTTRNFIKPTIEMMASLPSVVLGYLAAIVLAPWIESNILGVLLCGMVLPCTLYFFGNMVSKYSAEHVSGRGLYASRRLLFIILVGFALAMAALLRLGRFIESLAFGGDLKAFLSGGEGSAAALYGILLLPLVLVSLWTIPAGRFVKSWRTLVFLAGPLLSFAIGYALHRSVGESTLSVAGYSQRNALVICVAMGFAIIPIIYSLAEDALTSVPGSLRAGSLACGASVWQTTARVVLPTAASGIFSALMVGFGRAIGETMIVVMATGNSPLMSINPFEGLRSLAANIAVELPEAPQGGSHYRILFFSGFLLFVLTFSMNTLAEFMRTRYRKRNKAL